MSDKFALDGNTRREIARKLYDAQKHNSPIELLTQTYPDISVDDAYDIQKEFLTLRFARDRATTVGRKIGITSRGMMKMLNCDTPDYGALLDDTIIYEGSACDISALNLPIVEGEIAFIMGEDLNGAPFTPADIINATSWVVPCFEVCDVRFSSWKITVRDTIADNAAAARFMIGSAPKRIDEVNLRNVGMVMEKNGVLTGSAAGAEVMGNPVTAVTWLANKLSHYCDRLKKGDIVLSGAFMAAVPAEAGDCFTLSVDGFPSLSMRFDNL